MFYFIKLNKQNIQILPKSLENKLKINKLYDKTINGDKTDGYILLLCSVVSFKGNWVWCIW